MIEVFGFTTAVIVADACAKTGGVTITALDSNKPAAGDLAEVPLIMIVKMQGDVAQVEAAMKRGEEIAKEKDLYVTSHIIARPEEDTEKMIKLCSLGRDKLKS